MNTLQKEPRANSDRAASFVVPEVNIFETKDGYVLEAEMPGVTKESLEITLEANELTITGNRHFEPLPGEALFRESHDAGYRRVFELDPAIDTSKVSARMEQGVLTLTLPKSERVKPRKISVD
jgi:HSP20 family protein